MERASSTMHDHLQDETALDGALPPVNGRPVEIPARTLDDLAFGEILRALAGRCRTEAGRRRAQARPFLHDTAEVEAALTLVDEARRLSEEQISLPFGALPDVSDALPRAAKSALLEPRELSAMAQVLFAFERTRDALADRAGTVPALVQVARRLPALEALARRVDRCFEADGEISDRASPALKDARDRVRGLHRALKARLDVMLHDDAFLPNLREGYYTLRNGRYVLPVNAQHQAQVPGIVHNASGSGQTLFVEPEGLVSLGNQLAIAQSLVNEEERRILQELTDAVGREADRIGAGVSALAELDEAEAAARLASDLDLHRPAIEPTGGTLQLRQLRHPLLILKGHEVVPNDVRLADGVRALVVSGPNAGGKTVTLTAVGLTALMLRAGLPVPASDGSRLPLYRSVHSAVGDAQDLAQGLSTFSAHVAELREIGRHAEPGSLALIDEIAADTDPREGAALAVAVLEDLLDRGAVALVTTHLEELKALAHLDPRFINARVGFDPRKMAPTYRLQIGEAGSSSAIEIARRMGLSEKVCDRARQLVLGAGGPLAQALAAAEEERRHLAEAQDRAEQATREAQAEKAALEREREDSLRRLAAEEQEHRERRLQELETMRAELRELAAQLRAEASAQAAAQAAAAAQQKLAERTAEEQRRLNEAKATAARAQAPDTPPELRVGGWVHHAGLGRDVEILELSEGQALVAAGLMKMRVPVAELSRSQTGRPPPKFPTGPQEKQERALRRAEEAAPAAVRASLYRCDVRGMRADEALREVEQFLDRVYRGGEESALILHGHGTGALKQAIRESLGSSPYVRMFRPGESHEGGDGVTVVAFRQ